MIFIKTYNKKNKMKNKSRTNSKKIINNNNKYIIMLIYRRKIISIIQDYIIKGKMKTIQKTQV